MSLDEGMMTAAEIVGLLEDHGVDVERARETATTVDGEHVRTTLAVTAPVGLDVGDDELADAESSGGATDEDVAESVDDVQTDAGDEFLDRVSDTVELDDADGQDDAEADADGSDQDGRDDDVLPKFEDQNEVEADAGGGPAPETKGSDVDDEAVDELGVATVKSYGINLNGAVADHFDTDRVTVVDQPYGADLVPGTGAEGPDYAAGCNKVQLGDPGRREVGVDVDEEIRAIADGDSVRLEPVDGTVDKDDPEPQPETAPEPNQEDNREAAPEAHSEPEAETDDTDSEANDSTEAEESDGFELEFWCGFCGGGPESSQTAVRDHHDREDHPGEPVVLSEHPSEADVIENGGPDVAEDVDDRDIRERVVEYLLKHARDGDRFFKPEDIAFALDESGDDVVDVLNGLVDDRREVVAVRPVGVSGQMWCARLATPGDLTEGEIHSVAEASESIDEAADNFETSSEYAQTVLEAHQCLNVVVDEDQEVPAADD